MCGGVGVFRGFGGVGCVCGGCMYLFVCVVVLEYE